VSRVPQAHADPAGLDLIEADVRREAATVGTAVAVLRDEAEDLRAALPIAPTRVYLIGCGDSFDGGIAARYVWEGLASVPVEAVPAMTFATSVVELAPEGSLVVALSQSGKVSRVIEGVRAARARGLATATITASAASPLAAEPADARWTIDFQKVGAVPGTTSHLLGALAFAELGCAFAQDVAGRDRVRGELDGLGALIERGIEACEPVAASHVAAIERDLPFLLLGYGPTLSSARFTVRKLLELTQLVTMWQETEEYAHDEYSLVDPRFRVLQFCPPDRGLGRSVEVAGYLRRLGVHLAIVTDEAAESGFSEIADLVYVLPDAPASVAPFLYCLPGQLLALAAARRVGGSLYGMAERVHREDGDPQIYESVIAS
jgi:glucosamine--fructose-6-phosphate aminotransferase (isomerizing)